MKRIFFLIVLSGLANWGCTEDPLQLQLPSSELVRDTLYATSDATVPVDQIIATFSSSRVLLGSARGYTFRPVMTFSPFPTILNLDSVSMLSARVEFDALTVREGTSQDSIQVTAYPMMSEWNTDTSATFINFPAQVDFSRPLGTFKTGFSADSLDDVMVISDTSIIKEWIAAGDTTGDELTNNGFVLDFNNAGFIKEFQARDATLGLGARLYYTYSIGGEIISDSILVIRDAYLFDGDFVRDESRTQVSTLNPWASMYTFDIDSLNRKYGGRALVESANIQLILDETNSYINDDIGTRLRFVPFISPLNLINSVEVDTAFTGFPFLSDRVIDLTNVFDADTALALVGIQVPDGRERRDLASNYLRRELSSPTDTSSFTGFYLTSFSQTTSLQFFSFYRYNDPDPAKRPRLIIESLVLPEERF